jgi:hypothetical protein
MAPPSEHTQFSNNNILGNHGNIEEESIPIAIECFDCSHGFKRLDFCFNNTHEYFLYVNIYVCI